MSLTQPDLWKRIEAHSIDAVDADLPFSARLARENGWSTAFAEDCIRDYKRFCYLGMVCDHEVTPSDQVDQVWHLHLLYTHDYWDVFCPQVLGSALHHGPTKGGSCERGRFLTNYRRTLASYHREFGQVPPAGIWPDEETRFKSASYFRRINTRHYWMIRKRSINRGIGSQKLVAGDLRPENSSNL